MRVALVFITMHALISGSLLATILHFCFIKPLILTMYPFFHRLGLRVSSYTKD